MSVRSWWRKHGKDVAIFVLLIELFGLMFGWYVTIRELNDLSDAADRYVSTCERVIDRVKDQQVDRSSAICVNCPKDTSLAARQLAKEYREAKRKIFFLERTTPEGGELRKWLDEQVRITIKYSHLPPIRQKRKERIRELREELEMLEQLEREATRESE